MEVENPYEKYKSYNLKKRKVIFFSIITFIVLFVILTNLSNKFVKLKIAAIIGTIISFMVAGVFFHIYNKKVQNSKKQ